MFEPHQLFTGKSLTMFERVVFLLYLLAICFSFALFPNDGHETQRRQNDDENMVNVSSVGEGNDCYTQLSPCLENLSPLLDIEGIEHLVVNGSLALPCESNILEENRNCTNSVSQCTDDDFYKAIQRVQVMWDFLCKNSSAFVAGRDCWVTSELQPTLIKCFGSSTYVCTPILNCIQESVEELPDCSTEDAIQLRLLASIYRDNSQPPC